jgi:hypothetical protein
MAAITDGFFDDSATIRFPIALSHRGSEWGASAEKTPLERCRISLSVEDNETKSIDNIRLNDIYLLIIIINLRSKRCTEKSARVLISSIGKKKL